jgi:hypothetical protein
MLNYKLHQPVRRKPKLTISKSSFPSDLVIYLLVFLFETYERNF